MVWCVGGVENISSSGLYGSNNVISPNGWCWKYSQFQKVFPVVLKILSVLIGGVDNVISLGGWFDLKKVKFRRLVICSCG